MLRTRLKKNKNLLPKLRKQLEKLRNKKVEYGYFQSQGEHYSGLTYPELMNILEFGSISSDRIPPRMVFTYTYKANPVSKNKEVQSHLSEYIMSITTRAKDPNPMLRNIASDYIQKTLSLFGHPSQVNVSNKDSTIRQKQGNNTPLVWTGDLAEKMAYRLDGKVVVMGDKLWS